MNITLKDGIIKSYDHGMSVYDIAYDLSEGLARIACAKIDVKANGLCPLSL